MAEGNKHLGYKAALNAIERDSPGSKAAFYLNFVSRMAPLLDGVRAETAADVGTCASCGAPTSGDVCAFCRLVATASAHDPVPVEMVVGKRGRR